jgi:hypothetical protein
MTKSTVITANRARFDKPIEKCSITLC